MNNFMLIVGIIISIGAISLLAIMVITRKLCLESKWYGIGVIALTAIALGIHFGINLMHSLFGGLIIALIFFFAMGLYWFLILKAQKRYRNKNRD